MSLLISGEKTCLAQFWKYRAEFKSVESMCHQSLHYMLRSSWARHYPQSSVSIFSGDMASILPQNIPRNTPGTSTGNCHRIIHRKIPRNIHRKISRKFHKDIPEECATGICQRNMPQDRAQRYTQNYFLQAKDLICAEQLYAKGLRSHKGAQTLAHPSTRNSIFVATILTQYYYTQSASRPLQKSLSFNTSPSESVSSNAPPDDLQRPSFHCCGPSAECSAELLHSRSFQSNLNIKSAGYDPRISFHWSSTECSHLFTYGIEQGISDVSGTRNLYDVCLP